MTASGAWRARSGFASWATTPASSRARRPAPSLAAPRPTTTWTAPFSRTMATSGTTRRSKRTPTASFGAITSDAEEAWSPQDSLAGVGPGRRSLLGLLYQPAGRRPPQLGNRDHAAGVGGQRLSDQGGAAHARDSGQPCPRASLRLWRPAGWNR